MGWYVYRYQEAGYTGWKNDNNHYQYYINGKKTINDWVQYGGVWYHFNGVGDMQTGWYMVGSKWYYSDASGAMQTGWQFIDNYWYHLGEKGDMTEGWILSNKLWYYLDAGTGRMHQGWLSDAGTWYYLAIPDGHMVTGVQIIDGKSYNFDSSGKCLNPYV
ncbi:MAG: hypothetical protein LKJ03_01520 [Enterococcaceae bacterium]|jgi:glucan-binding YG repeat protein|nr:hypothetical protein [Enterococcaceae bacterium]MCI1918807.1 hypothetical protein [Enterococcaceae bacterium]